MGSLWDPNGSPAGFLEFLRGPRHLLRSDAIRSAEHTARLCASCVVQVSGTGKARLTIASKSSSRSYQYPPRPSPARPSPARPHPCPSQPASPAHEPSPPCGRSIACANRDVATATAAAHAARFDQRRVQAMEQDFTAVCPFVEARTHMYFRARGAAGQEAEGGRIHGG